MLIECSLEVVVDMLAMGKSEHSGHGSGLLQCLERGEQSEVTIHGAEEATDRSSGTRVKLEDRAGRRDRLAEAVRAMH